LKQMSKKKEYGQFYTHNAKYILQGMHVKGGLKIVEPFVGDGSLVEWCDGVDSSLVEKYDIDPRTEGVVVRDTLLDPPDYKGKFVLTNPPYLAKNKAEDKSIFDKYKTNDLYKCFINSIVTGRVEGGVIIVPLNFICDNHCTQERDMFFSHYDVERVNVFEEQVFDDTSYTVCSIQFTRAAGVRDRKTFDAYFYPSMVKKSVEVKKEYDWKIGGDIDRKIESKYEVSRLLREGKRPDPREITNIYLNAIDTGSSTGRICLKINDVPFYGKNTDRAFATLVIRPPIDLEKQKEVVGRFNSSLEEARKKHRSLFLVNYRNSTKAYSRKRVKFNLVYNLVKEILNTLEEE